MSPSLPNCMATKSVLRTERDSFPVAARATVDTRAGEVVENGGYTLKDTFDDTTILAG